MRAILTLGTDEAQKKLLKDMLTAMDISFRNYPIEDREFAFEQRDFSFRNQRGSGVDYCFGIWKSRTDFTDFQDFRKQVWRVTN